MLRYGVLGALIIGAQLSNCGCHSTGIDHEDSAAETDHGDIPNVDEEIDHKDSATETDYGDESNTDHGDEADTDGMITLYYGCDELYQMDQDTLDAVNQYLENQKCNYRIECVQLAEIDGDLSTEAYAKVVEHYADNQAIDICYLSVLLDGAWISSYDYLRQDGYLENLTPYMETESGEQLKLSMPEKKWESLMVGDELYGMNGYAYNAQSGVTYVVSKSLMEEYHLSSDDLLRPLSELHDLLISIQEEQEQNNPDFSCVNYVLNIDDYCYFSKLYPVDGYLSGICIDENSQDDPLIYKLDDEEYMGLLREMFDLSRDASLKVTTNTEIYIENNFLNVYVEGLFPEQDVSKNGDYKSVDEQKIISNDELVVLYPYDTDIRINDYTAANVILKNSAHKQEAFDFLCRMYGDEELSNLLQFGPNYEIYDGHVYATGENQELYRVGAIQSWIRGNGFLGAPCYYEMENKGQVLDRIYNERGYISAWSGFKFDRTGYEQQIAATNNVMNQLQELFNGSVTDFDSYVEQLREEFDEAGGRVLYDEVAEQLQEFQKK
jgi:hypothetical protein